MDNNENQGHAVSEKPQRRKRTQKHPVEKLIQTASQLNNIVNAILDNADNPDFMSAIAELKKNKEREESNKSKLDSDAMDVIKLLETYPGLSKQVLGYTKGKISEYKSLDILNQFKVVS